MFNLKNFAATVLALSMCSSLGATGFASTYNQDSNARIISQSKNITEEEIQEITNSMGASLVYNDGRAVPIDSVITIEDMPISNYRSSDANIQNSYKITLNTNISEQARSANSRKIDSATDDKNGNVVAAATLELVWTDGPGLDNVIDRVSGRLNVEQGSVSSGEVRYGTGWASSSLWTERNVGASPSFSYSPGYVVEDPTADYSVHFENETFGLYMYVSASVTQ